MTERNPRVGKKEQVEGECSLVPKGQVLHLVRPSSTTQDVTSTPWMCVG